MVKAFALLNVWHRENDDLIIVANENDSENAFEVWEGIAESQELNLPPYIYNLHKEVILEAWREKKEKQCGDLGGKDQKVGLTRQEVAQKYLRVYGRVLADWPLRQQIIPMLENAGLITQDPDPNDKRRLLIYPTDPHSISDNGNYSVGHGGVKEES